MTNDFFDNFNKSLNDLFGAINNTSMDFDIVDKMTVEKYFDFVCDFIESKTKTIIKNENLRSFGGVCNFVLKKSNEKIFVVSMVELYFQDINGKWIKKELMGKTKISKFDNKNKETIEFINQLKNGGVKQNINPIE